MKTLFPPNLCRRLFGVACLSANFSAGTFAYASIIVGDTPQVVVLDPTLVMFADLTDLGVPYESTFEPINHHYARNPWSLFEYEGLLFISGGDANNVGSMPITGPFSPKAVNLEDDSIVTLNLVNEEELNAYRVIGDQLVIPGIDPTQSANVSLHQFQEELIIGYPVAKNKNHLYDVYQSRRNGRFFAATGYSGNISDAVVSSSDSLDSGWTLDRTAYTFNGTRALAFLEFGPSGQERLFVVQWALVYGMGREDIPYREDSWLNYEYDFDTMEWRGVTNYIWSGLDPTFTGPFIGPNSSGQMIIIGDKFVPWKVTRVDDDSYMAVFGRHKGGNRFGFPGLALGYDDGTGMPDNVTGSGTGGVYRITLGSEPPNETARGETFLECERVLDPVLGRQWDYQVVGEDLYVLTETPDLAIYLYRNGEEVLRIPDAPTFARSFAVVGDSVFLGLGSEENDPYRNNGEWLSPDCGRILKAEGVLAANGQ